MITIANGMTPPIGFPSPSRTVFLHIGIHKTGTSAVQNVCRANRRELLQAGILFPNAGFIKTRTAKSTATSGHNGLTGFLKAPNAKRLSAAGSAFLREIESNSWDRLVLSSEVLSAPHNRGASECVAWFRQQALQVKLIVYLRRQDRWLDSFYRERLTWIRPRYRDARSIEEFWQTEGDDWLNYKARIGPWVAAAGRENAEIRSYDDLEGGVVGDFLGIIGVDPSRLDLGQRVAVHNPSIPPTAAELIRAVNSFPSSVIVRKGKFIRAIRKMGLFNRSTGSLVAPALWKEIEAAYADQNEELRAAWFSGPSRKFSYREGPGPQPLAEQAVSFADGVLLVNAMLRSADAAGAAAPAARARDRQPG